jgi:hypothetical protein
MARTRVRGSNPRGLATPAHCEPGASKRVQQHEETTMKHSDELTYDKCYHSEFGGYVYQIRNYRGFWLEPFVTEREAKAFIKGVKYAETQLGSEAREAV